MSHETPTLLAQTRDRLGTRQSRRLRAAGRLPAVIYGHGQDPLAVTLDARETLRYLHQGIHVFNVKSGASAETCLVRDLQFGHLGDDVIHVDLARVNLDEEVKVKVRLHFVGAPAAAAKSGVVLTHVMNELEVRCKVRDIPEEVRVDLEKMPGDALTLADFAMPKGCVVVGNPAALVAHLEYVAEEAKGEATAVAATTTPEVITAKKETPEEGA